MSIAYKLARLIDTNNLWMKQPTQPIAQYPETFGLTDGSIVNVRGVNYVPQRMSLRVRLHNWLIRIDTPKENNR